MGSASIDTADPIVGMFAGDDHSVCPECAHQRSEPKFRLTAWIARRLGTRIPKARCAYELSSIESGVGMPEPCFCGHVFHAS